MDSERVDYYLGLLIQSGALKLEEIKDPNDQVRQMRHPRLTKEEECILSNNLVRLANARECIEALSRDKNMKEVFRALL